MLTTKPAPAVAVVPLFVPMVIADEAVSVLTVVVPAMVCPPAVVMQVEQEISGVAPPLDAIGEVPVTEVTPEVHPVQLPTVKAPGIPTAPVAFVMVK